ncbi:MAG TPA: flavin reductase family protein [Vicinamibacteria bacterium]|nr:flavin reductase family protein [Vicinamibacteria bacterium]
MSPRSMPVDAASFRQALAQFASGVTVVTTRGPGGEPFGLTVSAFCSVSLDPPLVLVSVDGRSEAHGGFQASGLFGVSVLAEGQESISRLFARPGPDKFREVQVKVGARGVPLVPGALAHLECEVRATHPAGDHVLYVGETVAIAVRPGRPLLYHRGQYRRLEDDEP